MAGHAACLHVGECTQRRAGVAGFLRDHRKLARAAVQAAADLAHAQGHVFTDFMRAMAQ